MRNNNKNEEIPFDIRKLIYSYICGTTRRSKYLKLFDIKLP